VIKRSLRAEANHSTFTKPYTVVAYFDAIICLKQIRYVIIKVPNDWKVVMPRPFDVA